MGMLDTMTTNAENIRRTAVVTGANRGLGRETCRQLARRGFHVILTSRSADEGGGVDRLGRHPRRRTDGWILP
jgi:NAD(P)-dependent dehydrogenase (short-subunit alcohol dehydrogenase family)